MSNIEPAAAFASIRIACPAVWAECNVITPSVGVVVNVICVPSIVTTLEALTSNVGPFIENEPVTFKLSLKVID